MVIFGILGFFSFGLVSAAPPPTLTPLPIDVHRFLAAPHPLLVIKESKKDLITCACCLERIATFTFFLAQFLFIVSDPLKWQNFCTYFVQMLTLAAHKHCPHIDHNHILWDTQS